MAKFDQISCVSQKDKRFGHSFLAPHFCIKEDQNIKKSEISSFKGICKVINHSNVKPNANAKQCQVMLSLMLMLSNANFGS